MRRALLSVADKTGLVELARGLSARGFELVSTGGTARALADAGLPVVSVSAVTGFPEMMDGRVKTLHPMVHGGILARRSQPEDLAAAARHGITLIDLIVVNLYPFMRAAADPDTPFDALVEEIDIGGPSLVRAAAKNFQDVLVVVSPGDYEAVLPNIDRARRARGRVRHRRAQPGARRLQEFPGRARGRVARRLRGGTAAARSRRRTVPRIPIRAGPSCLRPHRYLRHGHRLDTRAAHGGRQ